jgi:hypothetical protein
MGSANSASPYLADLTNTQWDRGGKCFPTAVPKEDSHESTKEL